MNLPILIIKIVKVIISKFSQRSTFTHRQDCKEIQPVHPKVDQSWVFTGRIDVETETNPLAAWCEKLTHLKRPWCWEGLRAGGEGDDREWDGWMTSLTQWTWVWVDSRSWWWTGRPGMPRSMGSQRVRHDWATDLKLSSFFFFFDMRQEKYLLGESRCSTLRYCRQPVNIMLMLWRSKNQMDTPCQD